MNFSCGTFRLVFSELHDWSSSPPAEAADCKRCFHFVMLGVEVTCSTLQKTPIMCFFLRTIHHSVHLKILDMKPKRAVWGDEQFYLGSWTVWSSELFHSDAPHRTATVCYSLFTGGLPIQLHQYSFSLPLSVLTSSLLLSRLMDSTQQVTCFWSLHFQTEECELTLLYCWIVSPDFHNT